MKIESGEVRSGSPVPWGAHAYGEGVNFALFSRNATNVRLEFYENSDDGKPSRVIELDSVRHRTGDIWHAWVQGVRSGQLYGYRVDGPYKPEEGHRFNANKLLLDPFAPAIASVRNWDFDKARGYDPSSDQADLSFSSVDNAGSAAKSVYVHEHFDWEDDVAPCCAASEMVIYETHVRGFTIDPSAGVAHPGTFRGLTEKIAYLQELGVTVVELMPVHEFNENELERVNPATGEKLKNYWGYDPAIFFAPKGSYGGRGSRGEQVTEFREMMKAFHRAKIEVILDIVLNHTAERDELGPTICLRGLDNSIFYMLQENDLRRYKNFTGVGNTVNANHPVVTDFLMGVLRHWAMHMHVDGFRFDLASVLGRDEHGNLMANTPLLTRIAEDPILRTRKIIAEAWDAGGAYQVGNFSEARWVEWNGRFRDDVRRFWKGEPGTMSAFADRITGSSDLYEKSGKGPGNSVNFVTAHDGFTLNDLVSYNQKHNEENGEENRDGSDANYSDNCGVEGPSDDANVSALRTRLIKNFLLTLFISRGIPMLLGGDEFRRTQRGNNNAYCQDNEVSWYDWSFVEKHAEIQRFTRGMIAFRKAHEVLRKEAFYNDSEVRWSAPRGANLFWEDPEQLSFSCLILGGAEADLLLMFNAAGEAMDFELPTMQGGKMWRLAVDTSRAAPEDIFDAGSELLLKGQGRYRVEARSSAILVSGL